MRSLFTIVLLFCSIGVFTSVEKAKLQDQYKDWLVYTALEDGEKLCYIMSYPKKKDENYTTNRNPYIMVSYISKAADEVNVTSGFKYDKDKPVILNIDSKAKYKLQIIERNLAWAENTQTDQELILKMKGGLSMVVSGQVKTQRVDDTYSLLGFQKAYKKMHDLCGSTQNP